jgi:hypothetical protein
MLTLPSLLSTAVNHPQIAADCPTLACQTRGQRLCLCYAIRRRTGWYVGEAEPTGNHAAVHEQQDRASVRDGWGEHTLHTFPTVTDSPAGWEALHSGPATQVAPSTQLLAPQACFEQNTASGPAQPRAQAQLPTPTYRSRPTLPDVPHIKCGGKRTPIPQPSRGTRPTGGVGNNVNVRPALHPHNPPHGDSACR